MALEATDLLRAQVAALPDLPSSALAGEETRDDVDLDATLARFHRHVAEARKAHPDPKADYEAYFVAAVDGLGLANFTGVEIALPHKRVHRSGVKNTLPPGSLLPRLLVRLCLLQRVRNMVGAVRTTSIFRAMPYNLAVGGERNGQHPYCTAIDEVPLRASVADLVAAHERLEGQRLTFTPEQRAVVARVAKDFGTSPFSGAVNGEPFSARGLGYDGAGVNVRGGVGKYTRSGFVHRDLRGSGARWVG